MDDLDQRSGQDRRKKETHIDAERRNGLGRRLSDQDYRVMLEAERKRWEAGMDSGEQTKFNAIWPQHLARLKEVDAKAETDPVEAARILKEVQGNLEDAVRSIKAEKKNG